MLSHCRYWRRTRSCSSEAAYCQKPSTVYLYLQIKELVLVKLDLATESAIRIIWHVIILRYLATGSGGDNLPFTISMGLPTILLRSGACFFIGLVPPSTAPSRGCFKGLDVMGEEAPLSPLLVVVLIRIGCSSVFTQFISTYKLFYLWLNYVFE